MNNQQNIKDNFQFDAVVVLSQVNSLSEFSDETMQFIDTLTGLAPVYVLQSYSGSDHSVQTKSERANLSVVLPESENILLGMERLLRIVKRAGSKKTLIVVCSPMYSDVLPQITLQHSTIYYVSEESGSVISDDLRHAINLCSAAVCSTDVIAKVLKEDSAIVPSVWSLPEKSLKADVLDQVFNFLQCLKVKVPVSREFKKRVLVIYSRSSCHIGTVREHLDAYSLFSRHEITFINGIGKQFVSRDFVDSFDVVVVHYSVRISDPGHLSPHFYKCLTQYKGVKVLFIQDEYDNVKSTHQYMKNIDFDALFTCINEQHCYKLYPKELFPHLRLIQNYTGYVPYTLDAFSAPPMSERPVDVFYRGRELPFQYGTLGVEKFEIGTRFLQACEDKGLKLNTDIHSADDKRIYGDGWYKALSQSRTMLGTESGSNVFDLEGDLMQLIESDKAAGLSYDDVYEKRLKKSEDEWKINTISPKIFEAMMLGTVLVLYEGEYSGAIEAGRHYISLKKDFSNIVEVVETINDDKKLDEIVKNSLAEVVANPLNTYQWLIRDTLDKLIDEEVLILRRGTILPDSSYSVLGNERKRPVGEKKYFDAYLPPTILSTDAELIYDTQKAMKPLHQKIWEFWGRVDGKIRRIRGAK